MALQVTHLLCPGLLHGRQLVGAAGVRLRAVCLPKVHPNPPVVLGNVQVLVPDNIVVGFRVAAVEERPQRLVNICPLRTRLWTTIDALEAGQSAWQSIT